MQQRFLSVATIVIVGSILSLAGCGDRAADRDAQLSFDTPDEAVAALVAAVGRPDTAGLQKLLGPGIADLLASGDTVADRRERESFLARYREQHKLVEGSPDDLVLNVGEDEWPLPIPLVRRAGRWRFDGVAGVDEILLRRIGANELRTIDVMQGFVAAQREYAATGHDGAPAGVYARLLRSTPGRHDGLYWEVAAGEPPSPAGPLLAAAVAEGYAKKPQDAPALTPYHGYLYRMLFSQGPAANVGARDYTANGNLAGGFALLARPYAYGKSGVMTFIVNQDGQVWQRDLGDETARLATAMERFDPDSTWTPIAPEGGREVVTRR
jgi:hypothetical protein